ADHGQPAARAAAARCTLRPRSGLHRRRPGHGGDRRSRIARIGTTPSDGRGCRAMADTEQDRQRATAAREPADAARTGRAIARRDFEQVIRRAAELSLSDTDADEQLPEEEVIRIATELG